MTRLARPDLVPGPGQATGGWQAVLVAGLAQRCLRFLPKDHNEVAVQRLPDIRHKPSAVGVKPTQRQFLGVLGYVFRTGFIDLEAQQVGGLGYEVPGLASTNLAPRGFCCSSKPRTIKGGLAAIAGTADDLVTDRLAAAALTVDVVDLLFRFVILGSPEKPKGPGEGALWRFGCR
jgi:hypothetical protein